MTDLKMRSVSEDFKEEELRQIIEMLFFAYRDFTKEPDKMLEEIGLGRAHHRTVYFIGRNAGITVTGLLDILKIRKQSLSRVLNQLISEAYVFQKIADDDRRKKLLFLTNNTECRCCSLCSNSLNNVSISFRFRIERMFSIPSKNRHIMPQFNEPTCMTFNPRVWSTSIGDNQTNPSH